MTSRIIHCKVGVQRDSSRGCRLIWIVEAVLLTRCVGSSR